MPGQSRQSLFWTEGGKKGRTGRQREGSKCQKLRASAKQGASWEAAAMRVAARLAHAASHLTRHELDEAQGLLHRLGSLGWAQELVMPQPATRGEAG